MLWRTHSFLCVVLLSGRIASQQPDWEWARAVLGNSYDRFWHLTTDAAGNVYASGELLSDTAWFDGVPVVRPVGVTTASFLVMYNWLGTPQWGLGLQGPPMQLWRGGAGDVLGNSIFTGTYASPDTTLLSPGNWSYQCSTISSAGSISQAIVLMALVPVSNTSGPPIALPDTSFGLTMVASFGDSLPIGDTTHHAIEDAVVVARYTNSGILEWSNHLVDGIPGGSGLAKGAELAGSGAVGVYGVFSSFAQLGDSLSFGGFTTQYMTSTTPTGGNGITLLPSMSVNEGPGAFGWDNNAHAVLAGEYYDWPAAYSYTASYNSASQVLWGVSTGPCSGTSPNDLAFDDVGATYVSGTGYNCTPSCGGSGFGVSPSAFVQRIDSAGACEWTVSADYGNIWHSYVYVHSPYTQYVSGWYDTFAAFGPDTLPEPYNPNSFEIGRAHV